MWSGPQPAENFGVGEKSLLATIMTSTMCSQPWCDFFATISLPTLVEERFSSWGPWASTGGGQNGHFLPLLIGLRTKYTTKPEVNSLIPILIELILAMTVYLPVWHSHCTRASFTVLVSRRDELLTVHACPLICLQRQVAKLGKELFYYWTLLRNNNMGKNNSSKVHFKLRQ